MTNDTRWKKNTIFVVTAATSFQCLRRLSENTREHTRTTFSVLYHAHKVFFPSAGQVTAVPSPPL